MKARSIGKPPLPVNGSAPPLPVGPLSA